MNYAGHGEQGSWWEPSFTRSNVIGLGNFDLPTIAGAASCSTAKFAAEVWELAPRAVPVTETDPVDNMADAFLTRTSGGAVIYVGAVTTVQEYSHYLDRTFFELIHAGRETAGEAWLDALDVYMDHYGVEGATSMTWEPDSSHPDGGQYVGSGLSEFYHVYNMHLFGDPSLRLAGIASPDGTPPRTELSMDPWVNAADMAAAGAGFYQHRVELTATDADSGVASTHYRHRVDGMRSAWWTGTLFHVPVALDMSMEGDWSWVDFFSVNGAGFAETLRSSRFGYDFTPPESRVVVDGVASPTSIDTELVVRAGTTVAIEAEDGVSGVHAIRLRGDDGAEEEDPGARVELIDMPPCLTALGVEYDYWAEDRAGNVEDEKHVSIRHDGEVPPMMWELCFGDRRWEELHWPFPPRLKDELIDLTFVESIAGVIPDTVRFEFSGPVTRNYVEHKWTMAAEAKRNPAEGTWQVGWDTRAAGIGHGLYYVRGLPIGGKPPLAARDGPDRVAQNQVQVEPFLVLIDNLGEEDHTLTTEADADTVRKGDKVTFTVRFTNKKLGTLKNAGLGLIVDPELWGEKDVQSFGRKRDTVQAGEEWVDKFTLTYKGEYTAARKIGIRGYVGSDEVALLMSDPVFLSVVPPDIDVHGRVADVLGRPLDATLTLKNDGFGKEATTDDEGDYRFAGIPAGAYTLGIVDAPEGYRQTVPGSDSYDVSSDGRDVERNFTFARKDAAAPTVTQELAWGTVAQYGCAYGLAYDDWHGTGVATVEMAIRDELRGRWLEAQGAWTGSEMWLTPDHVVPLSTFLGKQLDQALGDLPTELRKAERAKLNSLACQLTADCEPLVWAHCVGDPSVLGDAWKAVLARATDEAGNESSVRSADAHVKAGFEATPTEGYAPLEVAFQDRSRGRVVEREWDFGDEATSTAFNPTHTYTRTGAFTVTLRVEGPDASDALTRRELIQVAYDDTQPGLVYLKPARATLAVSETFTVALRVNEISGLYGVQLALAFTPGVVEVVDADPFTPGVQIGSGDFWQPDDEPRNVASNQRGTIEYTASLRGDKPGVSGSGTLVLIVLHGLKAGTSPLEFTTVVLSDPKSVAIDVTPRDGQVVVQSAAEAPFTVTGRVTLERRASNAGARVCVAANCATTGPEGSYTLAGVRVGEEVEVTYPSYLRAKRTLSTPPSMPGDTVALPDVTLLAGDVDQDGRIHLNDGALVGMAMTAEPVAEGWYEVRDITGDGVVDIRDMVAVQYNWGARAPGPWTVRRVPRAPAEF